MMNNDKHQTLTLTVYFRCAYMGYGVCYKGDGLCVATSPEGQATNMVTQRGLAGVHGRRCLR